MTAPSPAVPGESEERVPWHRRYGSECFVCHEPWPCSHVKPAWHDAPLRDGEYDVPVMFRVTGDSEDDARRSVVRIVERDQFEHAVVPMYVPAVQCRESGVDLIAAERLRQIEDEGWTPEHDAEHDADALALAAAAYATPARHRATRVYSQGDRARGYCPRYWPWEGDAWKPTPDDRIRELVKAGALIAAEIDRLSEVTP